MLENPTLFVEPYLHQLTPPILTCLLTSSLPTPASRDVYPSPPTIRTLAASLLHLVLERHSYAYPSLLPRITKTLLRGLAGENRGLGSRWGAARGLSGIVVGGVGSEPSTSTRGGAGDVAGGGNRAIRDWVGNGLKTIGELLSGEEESYEGEREEVVREIYVSREPYKHLSLSARTSGTTKKVLIEHLANPSQGVLRASLLPSASVSVDTSSPPPTMPELEERYGKLFGAKVMEMWERGGREIWATVNNPLAISAAATASARGNDMDEDEDDEDDDDEDDLGEGTVDGGTETREGSAMEE